MVATRRGVRVSPPSISTPDRPCDVQATPSTTRRTRRTARQVESPTQHSLVETSTQLKEREEGQQSPLHTSSIKRCTRASRLHSPEQPCTPVGSTHGDVSDLESCCSVVSDVEPATTRGRRRMRMRPVHTATQDEEDISEVESCSSAVSAAKAGRSTRRRTRLEVQDVTLPETESCCSVVSESKRVTRSQRKSTRTRSSTKQQPEDSEVSDVDSCISSVSGAEGPQSTTRRATRSRRQTCPIPMHLDEASEGSPALSGRQSRAAKGKTTEAVVSDPCDSEGVELVSSYRITTRRRGKIQASGSKAANSDSDLMDVPSSQGSPCSSQGRGTPCSRQTGLGSGSQRAPASMRDLSIVLEKAREAECSLSDYSVLDSTLMVEEAECTIVEENQNQTLEEREGELLSTEASDGPGDGPLQTAADAQGVDEVVNVILEDSNVSEAAVTITDQQEELSVENRAEDPSEVEMMQETEQSSEPVKPCQSVTVTTYEKVPDSTVEIEEEREDPADVNTQPPQSLKSSEGNAVLETQPGQEERMEVSDVTQVVDSSEVQVDSVQVTSSEEVTAEVKSLQQPKDSPAVQERRVISLLESSEDEESDVSGGEEEEEVQYEAEERAGPSKKSEAAAASVEGLFMIDTRPGQEADDDYFREGPGEEEEAGRSRKEQEAEEDEDFVDEEEEDDEDEDAQILFSSRNPQVTEFSSRIDPGIRMKELGGLYINFDGSKSKPVSGSLKKLKETKLQDEVMKKSVIGPDFEKKDAVPPYSESKQALKLKRRVEREKSTGDGWFNMKAPELTKELKGDLQVLKMRGSMDPKRFYKKNDRDGFPKYFQVGTVMDNAVDFYHSRIPKKQRKRTMVEELLADAEFRQNNKKKYMHIVTEKAAQGAGRRSKKRSKFHKK
ncbi:deoxynucleotidyltransferase terminal-interacting protein 2 [Aulostomus maculatus]